MQELIPIQQPPDGRPVVSARELHRFMQTPSRFNDWIKRALSYDFIQGQDYEEVLLKSEKNPEGGRPLSDYALSLDCAKQIAMLQRSERGKQARQYFIEAEKRLQKQGSQTEATLAQSAEILLQQVQLMMEQSRQLAQHGQRLTHLETILSQLASGRRPVEPGYLQEQVSQAPAVPVTRQHLIDLVEIYCQQRGVEARETWDWLYGRLYQEYRVNIKGYSRRPGVSLLEVAEKYGHLGKIYGIIMNELNYDQYP